MSGYFVDGRPFKYFSVKEVVNTQAFELVKCVFTPELLKHGHMMDALRECYGAPLNVSSWYRTKTFNAKWNGHAKSCHLDGIATDIILPGLSSKEVDRFVAWWQMLCSMNNVIGGVTIYKWGIHFDSNNTADRYGTTSNRFRIEDRR